MRLLLATVLLACQFSEAPVVEFGDACDFMEEDYACVIDPRVEIEVARCSFETDSWEELVSGDETEFCCRRDPNSETGAVFDRSCSMHLD